MTAPTWAIPRATTIRGPGVSAHHWRPVHNLPALLTGRPLPTMMNDVQDPAPIDRTHEPAPVREAARGRLTTARRLAPERSA
jgi:hypothetical protein